MSVKSDPVRLNYIGSKYLLLDWLETQISSSTGWTDFRGKRIADLFGGTGIVSYYFREKGATVYSNDAELYSSIICHAFTRSCYNDTCEAIIEQLNIEIKENCHSSTVGKITQYYSPHETCARKYFTVDNARRIDYLRQRIHEYSTEVTEDESKFLLASLLVSADSVSNVPAVYGCFLKNFKDKAKKPCVMKPIHTYTVPPSDSSTIYNSDVCDSSLLSSFEADAVYLDPPYNERQYSKNYFPLNVIAANPDQEISVGAGVTGIPAGCFVSPFCKKGKPVESAFENLFKNLKTQYIFISYNSESLITKERMLEIMGKYGTASVVERDIKRFKSFEYNEDKAIKEYLFSLRKY